MKLTKNQARNEAPDTMTPVHRLQSSQQGGQPIVELAATIARGVRTKLLRLDETPRNLAGACGLAAMLVANTLDDPHAIRTGFYMKFEIFRGRRERIPYRHAWCRIGRMIVDATATQFNQNHPAVHVARYDEDTRYVETASAGDAIDDIMINWRGRELPAYVQLARQLRRSLRLA